MTPKSPTQENQKMAGKKASKSSLVSVISSFFDRNNEKIRTWQDLAINVAIFGGVVYAMHHHGHKLAV
jgi:hypothetical protein